MSSPETIEALNRVLAILQRSLPQYMRYSRPYIPAGYESVVQTIEEIAACQDSLADRVSQYVFDSGGSPDTGDFSINFTDTHDLSIDFLIQQAITNQKQDIAELEQCVDALRLAPAAQSLASEAVGMAKGHLESLQEIATPPKGSTKFGQAAAFANDVPVENQTSGEPHRQQERKLLAGEPDSTG